MKVLYIVTAYDRHPGDGITPWLVETIRRLRDEDIDVEVLAPSYRGLESGPVDGVMVHRFRYAPARFEDLTHDQTTPDRIRERPAYLGLVVPYVVSASLAARRLARSGAFDLVHVHWPLPHAVPGWSARSAGGIPMVITFHGVEMTFARHVAARLFVPFLRRAIRTADGVTANSTYTAGMIRDLHDRPVDIVPFGSTVPSGPPDPGSQERGPSATQARAPTPETATGSARLLFVGRLVERKGIHVLLRALAKLASPPEAQLAVVGEGPMRAALERQARELGVDDRVTFHGFVSGEELAHHFATCDLFVLPAVHDTKGDVEGLGVVLVEALAHGRPVVASEAGGITDVIRDGETGILVPPGDPEALAAAIRRVLDHPAEAARLAEAGRRHVDANFSWPVITERLTSLYRRLIDRRQRG